MDDVYVRSLIRDQLVLAMRIVAALSLSIGSIPLLVYVFPRIAEPALWGVSWLWWALTLLVYPLLVGLGRWYVSAAERNERAYRELTSRP